jgi:1-acyl-sn-glycerol-3-phosphate acyltransferase
MKYLRLGLQGGPILFSALPYLNRTMKHPERYALPETFARIQKYVKKLNQRALRTVFYLQGQGDIPKGQVLFVCNHVSNGDPFTLISISDRPIAFLSKKEVRKIPFIGKTTTVLGGKFIDREDLRSEVRVYQEIEKELSEHPDLSYVVFPEGTRATPPYFPLGEFHPGTFKIATRKEIPIVPVAMYFTDRILNPHYHYHRYPIQVRYLKPILPETYDDLSTPEISDLARKEIFDALEEMKALDRKYVKDANGYSEKKTDKVLHYLKSSRKS